MITNKFLCMTKIDLNHFKALNNLKDYSNRGASQQIITCLKKMWSTLSLNTTEKCH